METDRYTIKEGGVLVVKPGVTNIGRDEFKGFDTVTKVVLPRTIESIQMGAFHGCRRLRSINIPDGVRFIESWAFADCESLTEIVIPEGVRRIETKTFYDCKKLRKVNLPSTLKKLDEEAFSDCKSLKQIVVPDGVEMVCNRLFDYSWDPFKGCDALEKVIIREIRPQVSKTEMKKLVLIDEPQLHCSGRLYGTIIGVEPGEDVIVYARKVTEKLLWDSFKCSALFLDYEDYSFRDMPPVNEVLEYDKHSFAIVDMPEGASPKTVRIENRIYLSDALFYNLMVDGSQIEWIPLAKTLNHKQYGKK